MSSVREIVKAIQVEVRDTPDLQPDRACFLLNRLSAITGNIADEQRAADLAYAGVLLRHLESEEAASRAKIRAETTPEYARKREARDTRDVAIEIGRALKRYIDTKREEMRMGG